MEGNRDGHRLALGRICSARPIRVDYLDPLAWDSLAELLKTPEVVFEGYVRRQKNKTRRGETSRSN